MINNNDRIHVVQTIKISILYILKYELDQLCHDYKITEYFILFMLMDCTKVVLHLRADYSHISSCLKKLDALKGERSDDQNIQG